jgi:hypothetical protein
VEFVTQATVTLMADSFTVYQHLLHCLPALALCSHQLPSEGFFLAQAKLVNLFTITLFQSMNIRPAGNSGPCRFDSSMLGQCLLHWKEILDISQVQFLWDSYAQERHILPVVRCPPGSPSQLQRLGRFHPLGRRERNSDSTGGDFESTIPSNGCQNVQI